ncbi:MAG: co-chaperone GroES [Planctomycetota bacterium]
MNTIIPLNNRVIIEPESKEEVSKGGIIIPDIAGQKAPTKGRVIAISDDSNTKHKISVGDLVLFSKYAGVEIVIPASEVGKKDRQLQVIKDEDILAVIR